VRGALLLVAMLLAAGCAKPESEKQKALDAIATRCHLPTSVFKLEDSGELHFVPSPDAKFESVDCAVKAAQAAHLFTKIGFVGNETYEPEKK